MTEARSTPPPRSVVLSWQPERHLPARRADLRILAPPAVAGALGVHARTVAAAARAVLAHEGWTVASAWTRQRRLRRALEETWDPQDPDGTLRTVAPALAALLRAGAGAGEAEPVPPSGRTSRLLDLMRRYRADLRADGLVDTAEATWLAAARVHAAPAAHAGRYWAVASPNAGPDEVAFLDAIAGPGSLLVVPCSPADPAAKVEATAWAERGWRVAWDADDGTGVGDRAARRFRSGPSATRTAEGARGAEADAGDADAGLRAWMHPSQEDEVRAVLADVKRRLHAGVAPERIALAVADLSAYAAPVRDVAWELEIPVRARRRVSARETRPGAWLGLLAEAVREDAAFESTARLLAHPLSGGLPTSTWAAARARRSAGADAWAEVSGGDPRVATLRWPRRAPRAVHHARLVDALQVFELAAHIEELGSLAEAVAYRRVVTAAAPIAEPGDELLTRGAFFAELLEVASLVRVPVDVGEGGVAVHELGGLGGGRVDHLYVLGVAEGVLPAPVRDDPVLDFHDRASLREGGLPLDDAHALALREERALEAVLRTAVRSLTLSHPASLAGEARPPSAYLQRLGRTPTPAPARGPASPEEARRLGLRDGLDDPVTAGALRAWRVEARRESDAPFDAYDGVTGTAVDPAAHPLSATQLTELGQCAFRWFAHRVLDVQEAEEAEEEITPLQRGQLWHRTLELAVESAHGKGARSGVAVRAEAAGALEDAFERAEREVVPDLPTWPLRRQDHLDRLRRVLSRPDFLPDDAEVVALEHRFRGSWRGVPVTGRIDRVDRTALGLSLTDYKTRASKPDGAQDAYGRLRIDVQLPLYAELAATSFPGEEVAETRYYSLTRAAPIPARPPSDADLDAFAGRVHDHLRRGAFPVRPDRDGNACRLCDLEPVCRRGPRLDRKAGG